MKTKLPKSEKGIKNHIFTCWGIPDDLTSYRYTEARQIAKKWGFDPNNRREIAVGHICDCVMDNLKDKLKEIPEDVRLYWSELAEEVTREMILLKWPSLEFVY